MKRVSLAFHAVATALPLITAVAWAEVPDVEATEPAHAAKVVTPRLEWIREIGAESCITKDELQGLLAQLLGGSAGPSALGESTIEGLVSRGPAPKTWVARVRIVASDGSILGQREFSTSEALCSAITPSVLLVLQILVDPEAAEQGLPDELLHSIRLPAPTLPRPLEVPTSTSQPHPSEQPRDTLSWGLHLEPMANVGILPKPALGLTGGVALVTRDGWKLSLVGGYAGKTKIELEPNAYVVSGNVLVSALVLDLSVCPALVRSSTWSANACVGATLVTRLFETRGLAEPSDPARGSLGPSTGAEASLALTESWQLRAYATMALLVPRENFVYEDGSKTAHQVYRPSRFVGSLGLGLATKL